MAVKYLVTTNKDRLPETPILMVDGTVPGWKPGAIDFHFDHHRDGGADIQIDEMPMLEMAGNWTIITTQVDASACVAAAYAQLLIISDEDLRKLRAIAYDCDHLQVPPDLKDLADFAAQAVAVLKASSDSLVKKIGLPTDRKQWSVADKEIFATAAFKSGTEWLIDACTGVRKFPGEQGGVVPSQYWRQVEENTKLLANEGRVKEYNGAIIISYKGLGGKYIDPRCALRVVKTMPQTETPITLSQREVIIEGEFQRYSYTLGCIPGHPKLGELDYTKGTFDALTQMERSRNPEADPWGGRRTVGGSGWNTPSSLHPKEVIDVVKDLFMKH